MSRAPLLTLTMIVKDEADYLNGCLDSVETVVDEIVIVDTGSTDATCAIAERYGARLFYHPWNDSFAEARNVSLKHASGDWILYLDADERLRPEYKGMVRQLLADPKAMAFDVKICSQLKNSCHWGEFPRLFRNHPLIRFEGRIHEQHIPSIQRLRGVIKPCDVVIDHLGYNLSAVQMQHKLERNEYLLKKQLSDDPENAFAWYCLGNVYDQMNEKAKAIRHYQTAIQLKPDQPKANYLLGNKLLESGNYPQAEYYYQQAHRYAPDVPEIVYNLAIAQIKQSRYAEAIINFRKVLVLSPADRRIPGYIHICRQMLRRRVPTRM